MGISDDILFQILSKSGYVEIGKLKAAQGLSGVQKISLYDAVLNLDLMTDENLGKIVADNLKIPSIVLATTSVPNNILHMIPEIVAKKQRLIAFALDKEGLKVATQDPNNKEPLELLSKKTGEKVIAYYATPRDISEALSLYKKEIDKTFADLLNEQVAVADKSSVKEAPISKIVDLLVDYAYHNKASDVHIEPKEKESLVRFRIDGMLHDVLHMPRELHDQVITRIKVLSRLRTDEHLSAQDGKMQQKLELENLDIRVSIVPVITGEKAVLRLLSSRSRQFSLSNLGLSRADMDRVENGFTKPYGMVLATGPTGSGKTTTIYAIMKIVNTRDRNIATIEDPVEYDMEGINQIQVNTKTNLTFASGLRAILRQDPDVIFVGEIRDEDTAGIAVNSAMTGHMVLSTLHTNDAATTLPRLIDMKIEPFLVASTVNVIVAQRLVRKVCEKCRYSTSTEASVLKRHISPELIEKYLGTEEQIRSYAGKGCGVCDMTGYLGRIGVFEVLQVTEAIKDLITAKADSDAVRQKAIEEGMTTMLEDGLVKVTQGVTSIEEILRATKE